ncbi:MAG: CehA/McbA family metallohydrolase [Deltaproteobacteria bacterium]|nr:CehA/McbA family metallohydrolase [Deltaproteobacteria bacterium]
MRRIGYVGVLGFVLSACAGGTLPSDQPSLTLIAPAPTSNPYAAKSAAELIGGPQAAARPGDVILSNGIVRVAIQQHGRYPGVGSFGGHLIDADWVRPGGVGTGHDQFGVMLPMVNVEWTLNGIEALAFREFELDRFLNGELEPLSQRDAKLPNPVVVVRSRLAPYPYLDIDFLEPLAKALTGQSLSYDAQYDDVNDPFTATELRHLRPDVLTEYRLPNGARSVELRTTFFNDGDAPLTLPIGDYVNGSGELDLLIPGQGFAPALMSQIMGDTAAVIYAGHPGVDVSYGYFYDLRQFVTIPTGSAKAATAAEASERLPASSLSYSGVTGVLLGEKFTDVFPIGGGTETNIHFTIPAHGRRTITRYLVIGDGSAGSVLDEGLRVLQLPTRTVNGRVVDGSDAGLAGAAVAILNEAGQTIVTYRTDAQGRFSGHLPDGSDAFARAFGSGAYTVRVDATGFRERGGERAGTCTPETIDLRAAPFAEVQCQLGEGGVIQFTGPMFESGSGQPIPVRLTILGADPSPDRGHPGVFHDTDIHERPPGVVELHYLNARGGIDATEQSFLRLEPGEYLLAYSRGPEYELRVEPLHVATYGITAIAPGRLRRVVPTLGYVGADFHVHAQASPDSTVSARQRAIAAAGEGLDVLHSSDHDYLFDYAPLIAELESRGMVRAGTVGTIVGDEITPNHLGHIHAFPLQADPLQPAGGALDWSLGSGAQLGSAGPTVGMTVQEIIDRVRQQQSGELVLQVNHINDITGMWLINGLVTSNAYRETEHVPPLSTFSDPMMLRLPYGGPADLPLPWEGNPTTSASFTAVELTIGSELTETKLLESGLPQWFNMLNLGVLLTATADSDSHIIARPIGLPRNFVRSALDPADGMGGDLRDLSADEYARAVNRHQVIVSAGPFVSMTAENEEGRRAEIGDTLRTHRAKVRVEVTAPAWAWFDTIELYANTETEPVDDDNFGIMRGTAEHAQTFYQPYHRPHYAYQPLLTFRLQDGTLKQWEERDGVIRATVEATLDIKTDTWIVAFARGTPQTPGFRPIFPVALHNHAEAGAQPPTATVPTLQAFYTDPLYAIPAWGFTNPIFLDVDGDTNNDGNPFEALYVKQGLSPVK